MKNDSLLDSLNDTYRRCLVNPDKVILLKHSISFGKFTDLNEVADFRPMSSLVNLATEFEANVHVITHKENIIGGFFEVSNLKITCIKKRLGFKQWIETYVDVPCLRNKEYIDLTNHEHCISDINSFVKLNNYISNKFYAL